MSSDEILTERLKKENYEQFVTLVRMHLSFVVDINSDDVDSSTEKPKQFKWGFHRRVKSSTSAPSTDTNTITEEVLAKLYEIIDFLSKEENVSQEGIFRRTGSVSRQQELKALLLGTEPLQLEEGRFSVHDCASVLKGFLAELPEPLLMEHHYPYYCALARECGGGGGGGGGEVRSGREERVVVGLQLVLLLVGAARRALLARLLRLLGAVVAHEPSTRMGPAALATMLTPHLLCPRKSGLALHADATLLAPLVSVMVSLGARVLCVPAPLATDVRAYLAAHLARPHLDESYTDRTAARTVHTFVDARLSGEATAARGTEHALAQLYAHIHSLPDSAHKRRLVKHFNRHNGHGTPIQIQRTGRAVGRGLGDSIKRRLLSRARALPSLPALSALRTPTKSAATPPTTPQKPTPIPKGKLDFTDKLTDKRCSQVASDDSDELVESDDVGCDGDDGDDSDDSTRSEGVLDTSRKLSPKFVSEPNLSVHDETPKVAKERRLFRSRGPCRLNSKYSKRSAHVRTTPTSCVACFDDAGSASDSDVSARAAVGAARAGSLYVTSTPGLVGRGEPCTPPARRASMSPITKSTQKLPKAMQESIMTPRSRKPLVITSEQHARDTSVGAPARGVEPPRAVAPAAAPACASRASRSLSHNNDSDFVSSDDSRHDADTDADARSDTSRRRDRARNTTADSGALHDSANDSLTKASSQNHTHSNLLDEVERRANASNLRSDRSKCKSSDVTPRHTSDSSRLPQVRAGSSYLSRSSYSSYSLSGNSLSHDDGPRFKTSYEMSPLYLRECRSQSLTDPFKEYLLSRSVLTTAPVDLSMIHQTDPITDSMMFCLDGNVPSDLRSSTVNLVFDKTLNVDDFLDSHDDTLNLSNDANLDGSPRSSIGDDRMRRSSEASKDDCDATEGDRVHLIGNLLQDDDTFVSSTSYVDVVHGTSLNDSGRKSAGKQHGEVDSDDNLSNLSESVNKKGDKCSSIATHMKNRCPLSNLKQSFNILEKLSPNRKRVSSTSEGLEIENKKVLLSQKENFLAEVRRDLRETDL